MATRVHLECPFCGEDFNFRCLSGDNRNYDMRQKPDLPKEVLEEMTDRKVLCTECVIMLIVKRLPNGTLRLEKAP